MKPSIHGFHIGRIQSKPMQFAGTQHTEPEESLDLTEDERKLIEQFRALRAKAVEQPTPQTGKLSLASVRQTLGHILAGIVKKSRAD